MVQDVQEYGLYVKSTGVRMETLHRLSSFPLRTLDVLLFKKLQDEDISRIKGEVTEEVLPTDVFGNDPSKLQLVADSGSFVASSVPVPPKFLHYFFFVIVECVQCINWRCRGCWCC
jgi:hypothetical protein